MGLRRRHLGDAIPSADFFIDSVYNSGSMNAKIISSSDNDACRYAAIASDMVAGTPAIRLCDITAFIVAKLLGADDESAK